MDIYWLWLTALKGVGPVTQRNLVKEFGSLSVLLSLLCTMELEGKVMISGQIVKPTPRVRP